MDLICCEINCTEKPEWQIWFGNTPDDYTHACTAHVGSLLHPGVENRVSEIEG